MSKGNGQNPQPECPGGGTHNWTNVYEDGKKVGEICTKCSSQKSA